MRVLLDDVHFLEGPRWREGRLFVSDFFLRQVIAIDPRSGAVEVICEVPGQPSGLGWDREGRLLVVSMKDRRLLRLGAGGLEEVADLAALVGGDLNDMYVDGEGRAYVGNFGTDLGPHTPGKLVPETDLLRVDLDGSVAVAASGLVFPNGIAASADGGTLLVAETWACRISAFEVGADGSLGARREWAAFEPRPAEHVVEEVVPSAAFCPDGIALDAEGALWVADGGGAGIHRVAEGGAVLDSILTAELGLSAYACALGGESGRTLFVCAAPPLFFDFAGARRGALLAVEVDVPGV
ncbi:MAG: SMP-30/gluconolactonase/LRE family protein [Solirubrobacterales bacterium]